MLTAEPVVPDYAGANVRGIVPALLAPRRESLPSWMPAVVGAARHVVLLVVDGLGWDLLEGHRELVPTLSAMTGRAITTVAPSTTSTALTSITTGLTPGEHGLVGYRIDVGGEALNVLRWRTPGGDARQRHRPEQLQPFAPFLGADVPVVGRVDLESSAFSVAHLRGTRPFGWRVASNLPVIVGDLLAAGEPLVFAYYDSLDKVGHERGFGPYFDAELAAVDALVAAVIDRLPPGAVLLVTADHGQVQVGRHTLPPDADVLRLTHRQSGEGRFRWLHARPGAADELLAVARERHSDVAWVRSRREVVEQGWFGPVVSPPVANRLGDVALVAHAPISFDDPADTGAYPLECRHGSLTSAEMNVPLLAAAT